MKIKTEVKAIVFDLDGVLVEMPNVHYEVLNKVLSLFGEQIGWEEHISFFNGLPTRKKIEMLESSGRIPRGLKEFINTTKQKYTIQSIPKYCVPDYSKLILLKHLKEKGYKLACCSNSIKETLHLMLKSSQLFDFFNVIIGNDEIKDPKPSPEIFHKAFEALSVEPQDCVIVEDAPHGIKAAYASGAQVYEVKNCSDVNLSLFKELL